MFYFASIFLHGDSCPTGSANPEEGCESEGIIAGLMVVEIIFMEYAKTVTNLAMTMTMTMWMMEEKRMKTSKVQIPQKSCIISIHKSERNPRFIHIAFN
jgi:hypothetical protein